MRTQRPNLLRRLRARGEELVREYEPSVTIKVNADTISMGCDLTSSWMNLLQDINEHSPWRDIMDGVECVCDFEWDRQECCFRSKDVPILHKGQLQAFERYVQKLCEELRQVNTRIIRVVWVDGKVSFTKTVHSS